MPRGKASVVVGKRRGRPPGSGGANAQGRMLSAAQSYRTQLLSERAAIDGRLAALDTALSVMGGRTGFPGRTPTGRGFRAGSLKDYLHKALSGRGPMAVKDITQAVIEQGLKSKNKTLAKSVGIALSAMAGVQKVSRGLFQLA